MAAARGPVNSSAARPAWAVQLQYDFHLEKILSYLENHTAITLHKAKSTALKTPSILLTATHTATDTATHAATHTATDTATHNAVLPLRERGLTPAR